MLDEFFKKLKTNATDRVALVTTMASQVIKSIDGEMKEDAEGKNACIDAMVALLNHHKV